MRGRKYKICNKPCVLSLLCRNSNEKPVTTSTHHHRIHLPLIVLPNRRGFASGKQRLYTQASLGAWPRWSLAEVIRRYFLGYFFPKSGIVNKKKHPKPGITLTQAAVTKLISLLNMSRKPSEEVKILLFNPNFVKPDFKTLFLFFVQLIKPKIISGILVVREEFAFVGIQEQWNKSVDLFHMKFGGKLFEEELAVRRKANQEELRMKMESAVKVQAISPDLS